MTQSLGPSPFNFAPKAYQTLIEEIDPNDLFLVQTLPSGQIYQIRKVAGNTPASELHKLEKELKMGRGAPFLVLRFQGSEIHSLLFHFARAQGHFIPGMI